MNIENIEIEQSSNLNTIDISTTNNDYVIEINKDSCLYYSNVAKSWATKLEGTVDGEEFSAKYYAQNACLSELSAKNLATKSQEVYNEITSFSTELQQELSSFKSETMLELENSQKTVIQNVESKTSEGIETLENLIDRNSIILNNALNKTNITNCLLEAPNGLANFSGSVLTIKSGIKYLTGTGRNTDLTLKTLEYITESETNLTFQPVDDVFAYVYILNGTPSYCPASELFFTNVETASIALPAVKNGTNQVWFDLWNNEIYHSANGSTEWTKTDNFVLIGKVYFSSTTSSTITEFKAELPVELLHRRHKSEISSWAMPSNKSINLTVGASGTRYTAPKNGFFNVGGKSNTNAYGGQLWLLNQTSVLYSQINPYQTIVGSAWVPVKKGDLVDLIFADFTVDYVRFIYAEGEWG